MKVLELDNVSYRFPNNTDWVLKNINFNINKGELVLLSGHSGSGKSTILKIIRGLNKEFNGELKGNIFINGKNTSQFSINELGAYIGIIFQNPSNQLHQLRSIDEIMSAPIYRGYPYEICIEKAQKASSGLVDDSLLFLNPANLSLGQQQRIAIAASISLDADIILCDEPFSYLDGKGILELKDVFKRLLKEGKTILVATHDFEPLIKLASSLIIINKGQIINSGKPKTVLFSDSTLKDLGEPLVVKTSRSIYESGNNNTTPICWEDISELLPINKLYQTKLIKTNEPIGYPIFSFDNLSFRYPNGKQALSDISFKGYKGQIIGLLGPNGSGKSTLAKILLGFLKPQKGNVIVNGKLPNKIKNLANAIGYISQNPTDSIFETTVYKECAFGPKVIGNKSDINEAVNNELKKVGLEDFKNRDPRSLSGGEQRLLNIASILINESSIVLFDEPEFGLDFSNIRIVEKRIQNIIEQGKTVVIITHKFEFAVFLCTHLYFLSEGKIILSGNTNEIIHNPNIIDFLGIEKHFLFCLKWVVQHLGFIPNEDIFMKTILNKLDGTKN